MSEVSTEQGAEIQQPRVIESEAYKKSKEEGATAPTTETPATQTQEQPEKPAPETPPAQGAQETSELTDEQYWKAVSDQVGYQVSSEADLLTHLKSKRELEQELDKEKKKYGGLSPLALDIDRATKAGLDYDVYMDARKLQVEKLDEYQAIKKKYFLDHSDMVAQDSKFAEMEFERYYSGKYGILSVKPEDLLEDKTAEIEYAKRALKYEAESSKKYLTDWQTKNVTIPEVKAPTEEDFAAAREQYLNQATDFVSGLDVLEVPVGEQSFKYGLGGHLDQIKADMQNPIETLKRFGIDVQGGTIDADLFGELLVKIYAIESIGQPLATWHLEQSNAQTVKQKLEGPAPTQRLSGGDTPEKTHEQKVAEAFQAARRAKEQAG